MTLTNEEEAQALSDVLAFARTLHVALRDDADLENQHKPVLIAAMLLGLRSEEFRNFCGTKAAEENGGLVAAKLREALERQLMASGLTPTKREQVLDVANTITSHSNLRKDGVLLGFLRQVEEHLLPYLDDLAHLDVVGRFYQEFLRYGGSDGKGLGIILTPSHVTALFAELAEVGPDDVVLDTCTGTAGFPIAGLDRMVAQVDPADETRLARIRNLQLVGIENQPNMYALAVCNLMLRGCLQKGDGTDPRWGSNLIYGDCFGDHETSMAMQYRPTIGVLNPPYSKKKDGLKELDFIRHTCDMLEPGGRCVAIVPMACAIGREHAPLRRKLLEQHRLVAVMSMPDMLFNPTASTVTCVMVFEAHAAHDSNAPSWFGYWKDDGFIMNKKEGRVDSGRWADIRKEWLSTYRAREERPGHGVLQCVTGDDEWCAEAYMETDYSSVNEYLFTTEMKKYMLFKVFNDSGTETDSEEANE